MWRYCTTTRRCRKIHKSTCTHAKRLDETEVARHGLREHTRELRCIQTPQACKHTAEHGTIVVEHRKIAILQQGGIAYFDLFTDNAAAAHAAAEQPVRRAVAVVGALVAVLTQRAPELRHHRDHGVVPFRTERLGKCGEPAPEALQ